MTEKTAKTCEVKNLGHIDTESYERMSELMSALSSKVRLSILDAILKHGEVCACELESATELAQPTITAHLHRLYNSGIIVRREDWKYTYYSLNSEYTDFVKRILSVKRKM